MKACFRVSATADWAPRIDVLEIFRCDMVWTKVGRHLGRAHREQRLVNMATMTNEQFRWDTSVPDDRWQAHCDAPELAGLRVAYPWFCFGDFNQFKLSGSRCDS